MTLNTPFTANVTLNLITQFRISPLTTWVEPTEGSIGAMVPLHSPSQPNGPANLFPDFLGYRISWQIFVWRILFFLMARQRLGNLGCLILRRFTITLFRHTALGRTPLDEGPARRRDLYLTTHNTHNRQTSMLPVGFEPTILVSERPQTHALDRLRLGLAGESFNK
jgi:hypothetical protein